MVLRGHSVAAQRAMCVVLTGMPEKAGAADHRASLLIVINIRPDIINLIFRKIFGAIDALMS